MTSPPSSSQEQDVAIAPGIGNEEDLKNNTSSTYDATQQQVVSSEQEHLQQGQSEQEITHQEDLGTLSAQAVEGTRRPSPTNKGNDQVGHQASPLPRESVRKRGKKGFVLSRLTFWGIVHKKWRQTFWIQYGSHTMLWFRSESDYDDWLHNRNYNADQRNSLIKFAVNFKHDLYKIDVRGYQVTPCRTKTYGKEAVRQFKLETWTASRRKTSAAFGSYDSDSAQVDDLREAILDCMRNVSPSDGEMGVVRRPSPGGSGGDRQ